jgi:hypothetical protein
MRLTFSRTVLTSSSSYQNYFNNQKGKAAPGRTSRMRLNLREAGHKDCNILWPVNKEAINMSKRKDKGKSKGKSKVVVADPNREYPTIYHRMTAASQESKRRGGTRKEQRQSRIFSMKAYNERVCKESGHKVTRTYGADVDTEIF